MDFETDFDELAALAYRTAYRIVGSSREAEDIAQETMTRALLRWNRIADHARPWVCRAAANRAIDSLRRGARHRAWLARSDHMTRADASHDAMIDRIDLQRALLQLPKRQREVLVLRFVADLTEADVARELSLSVPTVKTHARRALMAMRSDLHRNPLHSDDPTNEQEYDNV